MEGSQAKIVIMKDGPYLVSGGVSLGVQVIGTNADAEAWEWEEGRSFEVRETYALCRCGSSNNAPFCDGTHAKAGFDGAETADRAAFADRKVEFEGPSMVMEDVRSFCATARFCDAVKNVWDSMEETGDPEIQARVVRQVVRCPSGRLVIRDKATGNVMEPAAAPAIGVVEDPAEKCSGPLWVRGGITVQSQDGRAYEIRSRVTLCRCGHSRNKPFCDGSHIAAGYRDGMDSPIGEGRRGDKVTG